MALRRNFLQSVKDSSAQPDAEHGACASSERRRFFSAFTGGSSSRDVATSSGGQSKEDHPISIIFSLTNLLDFKDSVQLIGAYKKGRKPPRKDQTMTTAGGSCLPTQSFVASISFHLSFVLF